MADAHVDQATLSATTPRPESLALAVEVAAAAGESVEAILADIGRYVDHESPTGHRELLDSLARTMAVSCEDLGLEPELVPGTAGLHLHASIEGQGAARVALLCHHDTVFPPGTVASRGFEASGDQAFGPGVADMKGGVAVGMHAAALLARRSRAFGRIELVSVPDEERRSGPFATLDRLRGFDAVLCLECGRPGGAIVTERKGAVWLAVEASGRAAHAGVSPESGRNAIAALCREAVRISSLSGSRPGITVELTEFSGGESGNSVAGQATLTVDVRAWREEELAEAVTAIGGFKGEPGVSFRLIETAATPPLTRGPANATLAATATGLAAGLGLPVSEVSTGGVSDASWTAAAGVPTLDGLGPVGAHDHSPDEYIEIGSIAHRCGMIAGLIAEIEAMRSEAMRTRP